MLAEEPEKPDSDQPVDLACSAKAARLMQKAIQTWQNHPSEHQEVYVGHGCEGKMPASSASNDQPTLATNLPSGPGRLRLAPVFQRLQSLLQTSQELVAGESLVARKKQWAQLEARCASAMPADADEPVSACAKGAGDDTGIVKRKSSASCPHGKQLR